MKHFLYSIATLISVFSNTKFFSQEFEWSAHANYSHNNTSGTDVVRYANGDLFVAGIYSPEYPDHDNLPEGTLLSKYNQQGHLLWMKNFSYHYNPLICAGTGNELLMCDRDSTGCNLLRLDTSGNIIKKINLIPRYSCDMARIEEIRSDTRGNCYLAFWFVNGGFNIGRSSFFNPEGQRMLCVVKFNTSDTCEWVVTASKSDLTSGVSLDVSPEGNCYFTTCYRQWMLMCGMSIYVPPNGNTNPGTAAMLGKINKEGTLEWIRNLFDFETSFGLSTTKIRCDEEENLYFAGEYPISYYGTPTFTTEGDAQEANIYLAKFNPVGGLTWLREFGSTGYDVSSGLEVSNQFVYLSGTFAHTIAFDSLISLTTQSLYYPHSDLPVEPFVVCYGRDGKCEWAQKSGCVGDTYGGGFGICVSQDQSVFFTGKMRGAMDFGGHPASTVYCDLFIAKLNNTITSLPPQNISESPIKIYPNPSAAFKIDAPAFENISITVTTISGETVYRTSVISYGQPAEVNLGNLPAGVYMVCLQQGNRRITHKQIVNR